LEKGLERGLEQGRKELILKMEASGMDYIRIAEVTGFPEKEVLRYLSQDT
jgi:hypothetical protein